MKQSEFNANQYLSMCATTQSQLITKRTDTKVLNLIVAKLNVLIISFFIATYLVN